MDGYTINLFIIKSFLKKLNKYLFQSGRLRLNLQISRRKTLSVSLKQTHRSPPEDYHFTSTWFKILRMYWQMFVLWPSGTESTTLNSSIRQWNFVNSSAIGDTYQLYKLCTELSPKLAHSLKVVRYGRYIQSNWIIDNKNFSNFF